jgi:hypothetical protein
MQVGCRTHRGTAIAGISALEAHVEPAAMGSLVVFAGLQNRPERRTAVNAV